jgi:protein-tyrosine phosphatase
MAPARILCVCTANICRSPMTELLLRTGLQQRLGTAAEVVSIESAGVQAREGQPIAEHAADLLAERGINAGDFRSRELTPELVMGADLVLCASREHKSTVIAMEPSARRTTFTVREFAWLLAEEPVPTGEPDVSARLRQLVTVALGRRGLQQPDRPEDFDLDDPYGKRKSEFKKAMTLLDEVLADPLDLLAQTGTGTPHGDGAGQQNAEPPAVQTTRRSWWREKLGN